MVVVPPKFSKRPLFWTIALEVKVTVAIFSKPLVVTPSKNPVFVNVPLIVSVPKLKIKPELLTELGIVTISPTLIVLSSSTPGTPGFPPSSSQVPAENQDPLLTEVKVSANASSSVPNNPNIKTLKIIMITQTLILTFIIIGIT